MSSSRQGSTGAPGVSAVTTSSFSRTAAMPTIEEEASSLPPRSAEMAPGLGRDEAEDWPWEEDDTKHSPPPDMSKYSAFERKYPPDLPGQEAGPNARVWRIYQDNNKDLDDVMLSGWNDSINVLLVFAGLFSAVLTAFLLEMSKKLEPDFAEYSNRSLLVLVALQNGSAAPALDINPNGFVATASDRTTTTLWYVSLTLSLGVAMAAILSKSWINVYSSRIRDPVSDLRAWARRHCLLRDGLDRWFVNEFVGALSVVMHAAVLLFNIGLIIHLRTVDKVIFYVILTLFVLFSAFYVASTVAPLWDRACPTRTPILDRLFRYWRDQFSALINAMEMAAPNVAAYLRRRNVEQDLHVLFRMMRTIPIGPEVIVALDAFGGLDAAALQKKIVDPPDATLGLLIQRAKYFDLDENPDQLVPEALSRVLRTTLIMSILWPEYVQRGIHAPPKATGNDKSHDVVVLRDMVRLSRSWQADSAGDTAAELTSNLCATLSHWRLQNPDTSLPVNETTRLLLLSCLKRRALTVDLSNMPDRNLALLASGIDALGGFNSPREDKSAVLEVMKFRAFREGFVLAVLFDGDIDEGNNRLRLLLALSRALGHISIPGSEADELTALAARASHRSILEAFRGHVNVLCSFAEAAEVLAPFIADEGCMNSEVGVEGAICLLAHASEHSLRGSFTATHQNLAGLAGLELPSKPEAWPEGLGESFFALADSLSRTNDNPDVPWRLGSANTARRLLIALDAPGSHHLVTCSALRDGILLQSISSRTVLSLLIPRPTDDGGTTSAWQILHAIPKPYPSNDDMDVGYRAADLLASELFIMAALGVDISALFKSLVDGCRDALLHDPFKYTEFAIHCRALSSAWWQELKDALEDAGKDDSDDSKASKDRKMMIRDVESSKACKACARAIREAASLLGQQGHIRHSPAPMVYPLPANAPLLLAGETTSTPPAQDETVSTDAGSLLGDGFHALVTFSGGLGARARGDNVVDGVPRRSSQYAPSTESAVSLHDSVAGHPAVLPVERESGAHLRTSTLGPDLERGAPHAI